MKKTTIILLMTCIALFINAQTQIENSGFEDWENVSGGSEPVNWNSFLTASGSWAFAAANQVEKSTDFRPGSAGTHSAKIWSREAFGIIANGNITLGRINMGSTDPNSGSNYNMTVKNDAKFHQVMPDKPDSLVFWVKFEPNGHSQNARMKATIHDDYDYRDPEDANSTTHIVGTAVLNYPATDGWERKSVPFDYENQPATDPAYILLTFTTNETPGGGKKNDNVWIDDVELIYNPTLAVEEGNLIENIKVYPNPVKDYLTIDRVQMETKYTLHSVVGEKVMEGTLSQYNNSLSVAQLKNGVYVLSLEQEGNLKNVRVIKK